MDEMTTTTESTSNSTSNHIDLISAHLAKLKKTTDSMPENVLKLFGLLPKKKSDKEDK